MSMPIRSEARREWADDGILTSGNGFKDLGHAWTYQGIFRTSYADRMACCIANLRERIADGQVVPCTNRFGRHSVSVQHAREADALGADQRQGNGPVGLGIGVAVGRTVLRSCAEFVEDLDDPTEFGIAAEARLDQATREIDEIGQTAGTAALQRSKRPIAQDLGQRRRLSGLG